MEHIEPECRHMMRRVMVSAVSIVAFTLSVFLQGCDPNGQDNTLSSGHKIGNFFLLGESVTPVFKRISRAEWDDDSWPLKINEALLVCDPLRFRSMIYIMIIDGEPYGVLGRWKEASIEIDGERKPITSYNTQAPAWIITGHNAFLGTTVKNHMPVLHTMHKMCDPKYVIDTELPKKRQQ